MMDIPTHYWNTRVEKVNSYMKKKYFEISHLFKCGIRTCKTMWAEERILSIAPQKFYLWSVVSLVNF